MELRALWGSSASDVWAVGQDGTALHWDGTAWSSRFSDTSNGLRAISGSGPDDVWAVTDTWHDLHGTILHWNGHFWSALRARRGLASSA